MADQVGERFAQKHDAAADTDRSLEALKQKYDKLAAITENNNLYLTSGTEQRNCVATENEVLSSESSPEQEQQHPILQKIDDLSSQIQELKKENIVLSDQHETLKRKYSEEFTERKRLYNEVIELKGNIRVFCRCRPLNEGEKINGCSTVVDFDTSQENELQIVASDSTRRFFKFDHIFRPEDSQQLVFAETSPIVTSVLDGYNVCIFAYGQTGTGKTFTMEGTPDSRGVNYRTLEELFRISKERSSFMKLEYYVSMLEVYNEKIRDLLAETSNQPSKKLEIKQAMEGTQEVPGLVEASVHHTEEVWELLKSGSHARSVGSTTANEASSRSHSLLRVTVKAENTVNGQRTRSHLWLVDLAGSERVGKIEVEGERLKESQFINKSLSALGDVISALASKSSHVPYRNSKLTHLLQSSLGGDCKTVMFVQISPSSTDMGETICSLNFASRVRGIENGPARRHADTTELMKYKLMAEKFKHDEKEVRKLQDSLQAMQLRLAAREYAYRSVMEKVKDLESQLGEERKTRIKQETKVIAAVKKAPMWESKPPLAPATKLRLPLRRITNFMPSRSPSRASRMSVSHEKENASSSKRPAPLVKPGITSLLPRRRASIATYRAESHLSTPTSAYAGRLRYNRNMGRHSSLWDPQKIWRAPARASSPAPEIVATPVGRSAGLGGSPPARVGVSSRARFSAVVPLQRKPVVWSPLKLRGLKNQRRSLLGP